MWARLPQLREEFEFLTLDLVAWFYSGLKGCPRVKRLAALHLSWGALAWAELWVRLCDAMVLSRSLGDLWDTKSMSFCHYFIPSTSDLPWTHSRLQSVFALWENLPTVHEHVFGLGFAVFQTTFSQGIDPKHNAPANTPNIDVFIEITHRNIIKADTARLSVAESISLFSKCWMENL